MSATMELDVRYAVLIYGRPGAVESLGDAEQERVFDEYVALAGDPSVIASQQLQPMRRATTVRIENGRVLATDGSGSSVLRRGERVAAGRALGRLWWRREDRGSA
jgi:hypothetical protein